MSTFPNAEDTTQHDESIARRYAPRPSFPLATTAPEVVDQLLELVRADFRKGKRVIRANLRFDPTLLTGLPFKGPRLGMSLPELNSTQIQLSNHLRELFRQKIDLRIVDAGVSLDRTKVQGEMWTVSAQARVNTYK